MPGMRSQYEALFDLSGELLGVADGAVRVRRLNRAWKIMLDVDLEAWVGKPLVELVVEEDRAGFAALVERAREDVVPPRFHVRVIDGDGQPQAVSGRLEWDGDSLLITGKLTEGGAVLELPTLDSSMSPELGMFVFERAPDPILWLGPDAQIVYVNRMACDYLGYTREEMLSKTVHDIDADATKAGWPVHWEHLKQVAAATVTSAHVHADGTHIPVEIRLNYIQVGPHEYICAIIRDITERVEATRAIERKSHELETLLFISSHDLREPLRAMRSFSGLLRKRYGDVLDDRGRHLLERIRVGGDRLDQLLNDLLTMSRLHGWSQDPSEVDLNEVVHTAIARVHDRAEDMCATIIVHDDLPTVVGDAKLIGQAVINLLVNALKFASEDEPPAVEVIGLTNVVERDGDAGLVVLDRGPGVEPEHAERIFTMFQRAVSHDVEGTGAGLAIVRRIAEIFGGSAWVETREGGGSAFHVSFSAGSS